MPVFFFLSSVMISSGRPTLPQLSGRLLAGPRRAVCGLSDRGRPNSFLHSTDGFSPLPLITHDTVIRFRQPRSRPHPHRCAAPPPRQPPPRRPSPARRQPWARGQPPPRRGISYRAAQRLHCAIRPPCRPPPRRLSPARNQPPACLQPSACRRLPARRLHLPLAIRPHRRVCLLRLVTPTLAVQVRCRLRASGPLLLLGHHQTPVSIDPYQIEPQCVTR